MPEKVQLETCTGHWPPVFSSISLSTGTKSLTDCGNFNGNAADDDRLAVRQRVGTQGVPAGPELLFGAKTPITVANRPDINNCPQATMNAAKADCAAKYGSAKMSCLTDYCFAGKEVALNK